MTIATQRSIQNEVRVGRADRDVGDHVAVEVDGEVRRAKLEGAWWTSSYSSE